ncbi:protein-arginine deiminase type-4 isoform X3 [Ursus maritimus]|uniref:Protein-arginine deiminase type-4 isoform X3 n=1 Tax=Ursus maritimus TaxID=29073 RepID=A0A8M1H2G4_URSMA|nr:protein-arginine deiminase type-4 isoform X3 [Ursus maritimus]
MAQGTVIHVAPEQSTYAVCVLGTETKLDVYGSAPTGYTSFSINASPGVVVDVAHSPPAKKNSTGSSKWSLDPSLEVSLRMKAASSSTGDQKVQISYYGPKTNPVQALLYVTGVEIFLSADITRTGKVNPAGAKKGQRTWTWGPRGQGAILLVNCDKDNPKSSTIDCRDDEVLDSKDLQDMSPVTLTTNTPRDFFTKHQLLLHVAKSVMDKVRVFQASRGKQISRYRAVLGPQQPSHRLDLPGGQHSVDFYVEGLAFPDVNFPGLISLTVSLLDTSNPDLPAALLFQDSVVFRVAPWIMTPNTQPPEEVYVCRVLENADFLKSVIALAKEAKCKLTIPSQEQSKDDRWMQDEIEIGYIQAPHKTLPVVFDSPRNRGLKEFPIKCMLGFRLLLASPRSCYRLFEEQLKEGHGEAVLFEGIKKKNRKIKDILSDKNLREHNSYVESCIDWNREVLKRELGLTERDIIDIPQLFKLHEEVSGILKAEAYFPNMVNMLVLGKHLGIPKPFGPVINGQCCLEEKVRSLLEPLGLHCTFIDDFYAYHVRHGEVHCGTNVRRQPFSFKWWHMVP